MKRMIKNFEFTTIYSIIHFLVDFSTASLILGFLSPMISDNYILFVSILFYDLCAFALQLPFGIIADKLNKNALVSALGCLVISISYVLIYITGNINASICVILCCIAGIGNALFHIGGGIDILNISNKKASLSGIYVSTGAIGLYIGTKISTFGFASFYLIPIIMVIASLILIYLYIKNKKKYHISNEKIKLNNLHKKEETIILFLFAIICVRGYVGSVIKFDWNTSFFIGLIIALSVSLGKALGGIIGDKFGWKRVVTYSLAIASILFIFAYDNMICGLIAMFLFNMTMPITLVALSNILYYNKGIAFGLNTLALVIGALPILLSYKSNSIFNNNVAVTVITVITTILLFYTLGKYKKLNLDKE